MHRLAMERLVAGGAPLPAAQTVIGHGMAAPTLVKHGSSNQQVRWLRATFTGEELWCQLFSEPGAGSDLAALATRAVAEGTDWIISGQKVWTTYGHLADWGLLLARTDAEAVKHEGLTYFVLDMQAPGVTVRPIRHISGDSEFCEVFLDDVRVPDDCRVGRVGKGWQVAITTLMNERATFGGGTPQRNAGHIGRALALWELHGANAPELRDRLLVLWIEAEQLRLTNLRARELSRRGQPGPESSVGKLLSAELTQRILEFCVDVQGLTGVVYGAPDAVASAIPDKADAVQTAFLRARATTIAGGTSEIMRTIIGERVLGLPPEPRIDKTLPWSKVPRS